MVKGKRHKDKQQKKSTTSKWLATAQPYIVIGLQLAGQVVKLINEMTNH